MATNEKVTTPIARNLAVASGTKSGDPVVIGTLVGVAETDRDGSGNAIVHFGTAIWYLAVGGVDGSGNSAVAIGDKIYYTSGDTPKLNKKTTGVYFGKALGTVGSGSTTTSIDVLLVQA